MNSGKFAYVTTPNGSFLSYDPKAGKVAKLRGQDVIEIPVVIPSDPTDPTRLNKIDPPVGPLNLLKNHHNMKNVIMYIILLGILVGCSKAEKSQRQQKVDAPKVRQGEPISELAQNEIPAPKSDDVTNQNKELVPGTIDVTQAIAIAEKFVHDNGYTDFKPDDPGKLTPESIEWTERDTWIDRRFNTIRSRAIGYSKGAESYFDGWTIGFELTNPGNRNDGRAVTNGRPRRHATHATQSFTLG